MGRHELFRRMRKSYFFVIGSILVFLILLIAFISPYIVPHDPVKYLLAMRFKAPQGFKNGWGGYILGTDALGQDVLSRLMIGSRVSLYISFAVVILTSVIGTVLGLASGYFGGIADNIIMRICDVFLSIPALILAVAVMAVLGNSVANLIGVLVFTRWAQYTRLVRSNVLSVKTNEFVKASKVMGGSSVWIMFLQILPNVLTPLIILMSQELGHTILTEAALSFLGLGVPPPAPDWGVMIADGREYLVTYPWAVIAPGVALMIAVLAFNFLGDGVRDVLDPKNKD